jgi:hypothetical protein
MFKTLYTIKFILIFVALLAFGCKGKEEPSDSTSELPAKTNTDYQEKDTNDEDLGEDIPEEAMGGSQTDEKEARNKYLADQEITTNPSKAEETIDGVKSKTTKIQDEKNLKKLEELPVEDIESFPDE